jgi:hypothetical protein
MFITFSGFFNGINYSYGLYYKSFKIVIYNHDSGLYYKTNLALARSVNYYHRIAIYDPMIVRNATN